MKNTLHFADTHCHLNLIIKQRMGQTIDDKPLTKEQVAAVAPIITEASAAHVPVILTVGTTLTESRSSIALAQTYAGVWAIVGLHPNDCDADWRKSLEEITKLVQQKEENKIVGIGETGLDYYWPNYHKERQKDAFKAHIELALKHDLALVIHLRPAKPLLVDGLLIPAPDCAYDDLFELLTPYKSQITRGIMHCFCHDQSFIDQARTLGFMFGIGGVITYPKNEDLRTLVRAMPLEEIVLETDAPFLPPQIARGTQNHPKHIATIAQFLADLKNTSIEEVSQQTSANVKKLFGIV